MTLAARTGAGDRPVRLSAAMIVRDEERFLPDCLRSLAGVADEVVVVDTGSVDATPDIARAHDVRLFQRPWAGDFAAARNHALDLCTGEWILYIDADERLLPADREQLAAALAAPDVVACNLWFSARVGQTPYSEMRVWRNDPRLRFRGCIHETIRPAVAEVAARDGLRIGECPLEIQHLGYEDRQEAKHRRNLPLLLRRVREDPGNVFNWCHLARVHIGLGEREAGQAAFRRAVQAARDSARPRPQDGQAFAELAQSLAAGGGPEQLAEAERLVDEGLERHPRNLFLSWVRANLLMARSRHAAALPVLEALAAIDAETFRDPYIGYDKRIFGVFAYEALALCHFRLERYAEAARWYVRAFQAAPDRMDYELRRRVAEGRLRRTA
jgi:Glycosyltransferases involved in cell wall biogenesis